MSAVPMKVNSQCPFADVDEVSDEIFDKVIPFPSAKTEEAHAQDKARLDAKPASRAQDFFKTLLGVVSKFSAIEEPGAADGAEWANGVTLFVDEEGRLHLSDANSGPGLKKPKKKSHGGLAHYLALPDDVRMLESKPQAPDDEITLAAIRKVMLEQERETASWRSPTLLPAE